MGTAALAAPDTIKNVQVRILDQTSVNKQYWSPTDLTFDGSIATPEQMLFIASQTGANWSSWSVSSGIVFTAGKQYQFEARALSNAGNLQVTWYPTTTATFDNVPPQTGLSYPAQGAAYVNNLPSISGMQQDLPAGVQPASTGTVSAVYMRLQRLTDNYTWDDTLNQWRPVVSSMTVPSAQVYVSSWLYTAAPMPSMTSGASYYLSSVGLPSADEGGNLEAYYSVRGSTFIFDTTPPTSGIGNFVHLATMSALATITGTTSDGPG